MLDWILAHAARHRQERWGDGGARRTGARQLLQRLQGVLQTQRRALAELIAQLGEVEERRLHLQAACSSLFSYCVQRLGMSEDEACRRIEVARLARRFPALLAELASGGLTLSVALLLKRVLSAENHLELIAAVRGASTERARELLAARFPSPDVQSGIRKLPESAISKPVLERCRACAGCSQYCCAGGSLVAVTPSYAAFNGGGKPCVRVALG